MIWLCTALLLQAHADEAQLHKDCFSKNRAHACVQLGTTLWQVVDRRPDALKAFKKGCELHEESACQLKDLQLTQTTKSAPTATPAPMSGLRVRKAGAETFAVKRGDAIAFAANLKTNTQDARLEPSKKGDVIEGYRFAEMEPSSVYRKLGLQMGDLILSINDHPVGEKMDATTLLTLLTMEDRYLVKYRRADMPRTLTLLLED